MQNSGLRLSDTVSTAPLGPKFPLKPMGVLAPRVCARKTLRSSPHRRERKFSGTRVCRVTFLKFPHFPVKIGLFWGVGGSPNFFLLLESSYLCYLGAHAKIWNPTTTPYVAFFEIYPLSGQNRVILGGRGGPRIYFFIGILLFLLLRSPCKNLKPYDNSLCGFE